MLSAPFFALFTKRKETIFMSKVPEMFGSMVFNDKKMQERLPKSTYKALKRTVQNGEPLDLSVANVVANAMKDWAVEMGCTHYTHWFQPMTGVTAEKHDSFTSRASPTRPPSRAAASARPLRREATPHGIPPLPLLSATRHFTFPPRSVPTQARFSIRKLLFSVRWSV